VLAFEVHQIDQSARLIARHNGTKSADLPGSVPGMVKLPYFADSRAMFSLMTSVSPVRRTWGPKPFSGRAWDSMAMRAPFSYEYGKWIRFVPGS
jgi:hypothetical protein